MQLLDVVDGDVLGHIDRLGDGAGDEGLDGGHHAHVTLVLDGVIAHRAGKDGQVCGRQVRRPDDRLVFIDVGDHGSNLVRPVAQPGQGPRHGPVDNRHRPAANQLLHFHQTKIGLDAGRVAVHQQTDGPGGCQDAGLGIAHPVLLAELDGRIPCLLGGGKHLGWYQLLVDGGRGVAVHAQHVEHRLAVLLIARERAHAGGRAS